VPVCAGPSRRKKAPPSRNNSWAFLKSEFLIISMVASDGKLKEVDLL
jgi:hypothetical protein